MHKLNFAMIFYLSTKLSTYTHLSPTSNMHVILSETIVIYYFIMLFVENRLSLAIFSSRFGTILCNLQNKNFM